VAYDLYVLNQRLPRFPLRPGYADPHAMRSAVDAAFHAWIVEAIIGNLQRRKACSQIYALAAWMDGQGLFLETLAPGDFARFLAEAGESPLCRLEAFLAYARRKVPDLAWEPADPASG
jgi:hypothetical protein